MNYSDPSGLCTSDETEKITYSQTEDGDWSVSRQCLASGGSNWRMDGFFTIGQQTMMSALYGVANRVAGLESAINTYGEITGVNSLGEGADRIFRGDVVGGGVQLALALPIIPGGGGAGRAVGPIAGRITGFTKHGINMAIGHDGVGVATWAILDAVKNPLRTTLQSNGRIRYMGQSAAVVLNSAGEVVTTWARSSSAWRIRP